MCVFAVLAFLVGRQPRGVPEPHRSAWRITAMVYVPFAAVLQLSNLFACVAFFLGAGHPAYDAYIKIFPAANHSRTFVAFAFYAALLLLARRGGLTPRQMRGVKWAIAAAMLVGAVIGVMEGSDRHFINTVVVDMVAFGVLAPLLLYMMVRDTVDRDLWFCLTLLGITSLFGALYMTAMTYFGYEGTFSIDWQLYIIRGIMTGLVTVLAAHRYRMARRGKPVTGLLPAPRTQSILA